VDDDGFIDMSAEDGTVDFERSASPGKQRENGGLVGIPRRSGLLTCHLNATLQVIFSIKELSDVLKE
jgi:ubiquitin C-terminal hydrolase